MTIAIGYVLAYWDWGNKIKRRSLSQKPLVFRQVFCYHRQRGKCDVWYTRLFATSRKGVCQRWSIRGVWPKEKGKPSLGNRERGGFVQDFPETRVSSWVLVPFLSYEVSSIKTGAQSFFVPLVSVEVRTCETSDVRSRCAGSGVTRLLSCDGPSLTRKRGRMAGAPAHCAMVPAWQAADGCLPAGVRSLATGNNNEGVMLWRCPKAQDIIRTDCLFDEKSMLFGLW